MGTWGEGMQDSDKVLDMLGEFGEFDSETARTRLPEDHPSVRVMFGKLKEKYVRDDDWDIYVLGLADWLIDEGEDLTPVRGLMCAAIAREREHCRLKMWTDPDRRDRALLDFEMKIENNLEVHGRDANSCEPIVKIPRRLRDTILSALRAYQRYLEEKAQSGALTETESSYQDGERELITEIESLFQEGADQHE